MVLDMDWWLACATRTSSRVRVSDRTDMKTSTSMRAAPSQAQRQPNCFLSCAMKKNLSQYIGLGNRGRGSRMLLPRVPL